MITYSLGTLTSVPASTRPELLAPSVLEAITTAGLLDEIGVVEIDPAISDTAATQAAFALASDNLANCVIVAGKREGVEKIAACVVLASTRADVNNVVKRRLEVRKASFLAMDSAVALSGMEYGGITPIGLPVEWPVLVDSRVGETEVVIIGSGIRASKILLPGSLLARFPGVELIENLGKSIEPAAPTV